MLIPNLVDLIEKYIDSNKKVIKLYRLKNYSKSSFHKLTCYTCYYSPSSSSPSTNSYNTQTTSPAHNSATLSPSTS